MSNLAQLEADLHRIDARLDAIAGGTGEPTDEDLTEYADLTTEREEREREVQDARQRLRATLNLGQELRQLDRRSGSPDGVTIAAGMPRDYTRLFGPPKASPWKPGEFLSVALRGLHDPRIHFFSAMNEGSGAAGGLLVPEQLERQLLDRVLHKSIVMSHSTISPMVSKTKVVAGFAAQNQGETLYGFQFSWLSELQTVVPGSGQVRAIELVAHLAGIYVQASNELLSDASGLESELMLRLGDAVAEELDASFINGLGGGQPLGYLKSGALLQVPKEAAQGNGTVLTENILRMVSHSTDFQNAVWVCNPSVLPQLGTLSFTVGASTAASVLLTQSNGELMLMGRPVAFNHKCPILGQVGDIALCSFGSYVVGLRQGVAVESSPHPGFTSNAATFRALVRIDGQPIISTPYVGADGRSYSPFVALALR